jgi:predicted methyltransferase
LAPETPIVLSHIQARPLLDARATGATQAETSLDLGLTRVSVSLSDAGVELPGRLLGWVEVERIAGASNKCFVVGAGQLEEIRVLSETTNWVRTLLPTAGAPTTLISGIPMHRVQETEPWADTLLKVKTLAPLSGHVLDTATGLGYTAIVAARTAEHVVTIEYDPAALEIARLNPWSQALFDNPRITQIVGDAADEVRQLPSGSFARILHDPPTMALGGELYSGAFYRELRRLLARKGRLFHYIGDPASPYGRNTTRGVMRRLQEAGFTRVTRRPEAFGVVATV